MMCAVMPGPSCPVMTRAQLTRISACPGKVGTGFPKRTCANKMKLKRISIQPNRDAL
jgi:hypothetical protein